MHLRFQSNTIFVLIIENFGLPIWIFVLFFFSVLKSSCRRRNSSAYPDTFLRAWRTLLLGFCGQDYTHQLLSAIKCTKCLNDFWLLPKHAWFNVFSLGRKWVYKTSFAIVIYPPVKDYYSQTAVELHKNVSLPQVSALSLTSSYTHVYNSICLPIFHCI